LVELMLVVLIIAVLLAIAIPDFLGARGSANARAAESNLSTALSAEQAYFTATQSFSAYLSDLKAVEPNLNWSTASPTTEGGSTVSAITYGSSGAKDTSSTPDSNDGAVILQAYARDGNCYALFQMDTVTSGLSPGTYYNVTSGQCSATGLSTVPASTSLKTTGKASSSSNIGSGNWYPSF
jgi:type IV pilus assembly protein PilA